MSSAPDIEETTMKQLVKPRRLRPYPDLPASVEVPREPRSLAALVAEAYERLSLRSRARLLARLLAPVGSLALAVLGGGAFARFITAARRGRIVVSIEDAARTTGSQIYELARYVQQCDPVRFGALVDEIRRVLGNRGGPVPALI